MVLARGRDTWHDGYMRITKHTKHNYRIGSKIKYRNNGGQIVTLVVDEIEEDIKNGQPGFGGNTEKGEGVWGYDDQVIAVLRY